MHSRYSFYNSHGHPRNEEPVIAIPEENIAINSRCMIVRKNDAGELVNLQENDLEIVKKYFVHMDS